MKVKHAASALGETIGKLIEDEIERCITPICKQRRYYYDRGGKRPDTRNGVKLSMVNKSGNLYQLDGVIENAEKKPIVLIESKYLRYKKHNRDKGSWTCASHYSLRKSYPTIRKSIAILSGNWSKPSKLFMESFGIELYEVPFDYMCEVLGKYDIDFDWPENDIRIPRSSWTKLKRLGSDQTLEIGGRLLDPIRRSLAESVALTLDDGENWAKRVKQVEILLKTDRNEYFTYTFTSNKDALQFLLKLQVDAPDLRGML
jgi:hypothetical protein